MKRKETEERARTTGRVRVKSMIRKLVEDKEKDGRQQMTKEYTIG